MTTCELNSENLDDSCGCPVPVEEVSTSNEQELLLADARRSDLMHKHIVFLRNGKPRAGIIVGVGVKFIKIKVLGMKTMTKIPRDTPMEPMVTYVVNAVMESLEEEQSE